jgi:site-specific DNA recombinase
MDEFVRAALYARVSTDRQAQQLTIASQVSALCQRISDDGLTLDPELSFVDDGYSGSHLQRPALERLRDLAFAGGLDRLYVHAPDRLARKYAYQVLLLEEFTKQGVEVIFLNQFTGPVSPEQEMLRQVEGVFAEFERAKILERTRRGRRYAARRGDVAALAAAPFGYRYVSKQEGGGMASYQIVAEQARVVQEIFHWVGVEGLSLGAVARRLHEQGVLTHSGKTRWERKTLHNMLSNPAYKGQAGWGKTQSQPLRAHGRRRWCGRGEQQRTQAPYARDPEQWETITVPALISAELFANVAEKLADNRQRRRAPADGAGHLLQGLLICQQCQRAYCGRRLQQYVYYRCLGTDAHRCGGKAICNNAALHGPKLEEAVWADVRSLLQNPERLRQEFARRLERDNTPTADPQQEQIVSQCKCRIARLIDAYEHGLLDKEEFEPRLRQAKEHLARHEQEIAQRQQAAADTEQLRLVISEFGDFAEQMTASLDQADNESKRKILGLLIKRIEVRADDIRIVYKVTPAPFAQSPIRGNLHHCGRLPEISRWLSEAIPPGPNENKVFDPGGVVETRNVSASATPPGSGVIVVTY